MTKEKPDLRLAVPIKTSYPVPLHPIEERKPLLKEYKMSKLMTKEMDLEDLAAEIPKAIRLLTKRDIVCLRCGTPLWKTVEEAIKDAGLEDVDGIVKEINDELLLEEGN